MNAAERQALREKHRERIADTSSAYDCSYCHPCETDWPCDTIKVLDAWEAQNAIIQDLCTSKKLYDDDYVREHIGEMTK